ncbi:MAG: DUF362 domain-containing protein [Candidatus Omnitrophica bacterium]|nr:DUF362 domain-containing protein [Candidatus Omnitrophota bacterium]
MKKVIVLKIDNYDVELVKAKLKETIFKNFTLDNLFLNQDKILLKPNLLMASHPDEAIVTHPVIVEAVAKIFKERGYKIFIADCPGGFLAHKELDLIYDKTGISDVANRLDCKLLYPDRVILKEDFPFAWWVDGFGIVNLAKLKTHQIMVLTLATKNLYGCIAGLHKSYLHKEYPKAIDFAKIILKLYKILNPPLNIVDGIFALQGKGPAKEGVPKKLGIVVIGNDALYTDYIISELLGLSHLHNPLISIAKKEGLLNERIEVISEVDKIKDFKFTGQFIVNYFPSPLIFFAKMFFKFYPEIDIDKCIGCGLCIKSCPKSAIYMYNKKANIEHKNCIMCFCCQEVCKEGAVYLEEGTLLKILNRIKGR